ncbi:hypothetical protein AOLI_G00237680 [Acnodon oligacanthus]
MTENISVSFYGDYELERNPITYIEALLTYKDLPNMLRESGAVPVRVWLYPLKLLSNKAAKLVSEISERLVSKTESLLEGLGEVERRCSDLVRNRSVDDFLDVKGRLQMFQDLFSAHKIAFQKAFFKVLPAIRGGTQEEPTLANILNVHYRSPFAANNLNQWLDNITNELDIPNSYMRRLRDIRVVTSLGQLNSILFDLDIDIVICLSFTSLKYKDTYLDTLKDFVNSEVLLNPVETSTACSFQVTEPWFTSSDISKTMRQNLSLFTSFSKANNEEKGTQFVIASISDPASPGTSIQLYDKGKLINQKFQPVSKPSRPTVEIQNQAITLKLQKPPTGETLRFRVEYEMVKAGETIQEENLKTRDTPDAETPFVLPGLKPENQYSVRYKAVSAAGVSEVSESVRAEIPDRIESIMVGGTGGTAHVVIFQDTHVTVKKIRVSLERDMVGSLHVTFSNDQKSQYGTEREVAKKQECTFQDGDRFHSLTLWPNA